MYRSFKYILHKLKSLCQNADIKNKWHWMLTCALGVQAKNKFLFYRESDLSIACTTTFLCVATIQRRTDQLLNIIVLLWPSGESSLLLCQLLVLTGIKQCLFQLPPRYIAAHPINGSQRISAAMIKRQRLRAKGISHAHLSYGKPEGWWEISKQEVMP